MMKSVNRRERGEEDVFQNEKDYQEKSTRKYQRYEIFFNNGVYTPRQLSM